MNVERGMMRCMAWWSGDVIWMAAIMKRIDFIEGKLICNPLNRQLSGQSKGCYYVRRNQSAL